MRADFARAAASYDGAAVLARETGARMAERLDLVRLAPRRMADIGCATGDGVRELQRRYPAAVALAIDYARPMLAAVRARVTWTERWLRRGPLLLNADVQSLPLCAGALDLAWSNLVLHWLADPLPALREIHRALQVDGLLMFSMLGPDTLKELRGACALAGIEPPLRRFHDMHDVGDMLLAAGYADPVMDMEILTLTYSSARGLLADQRCLGVRNSLLGHLPWRRWRRVFKAYEALCVDGRLPASFEIVYGHAWKAQPKAASDGRAIIRFAQKP